MTALPSSVKSLGAGEARKFSYRGFTDATDKSVEDYGEVEGYTLLPFDPDPAGRVVDTVKIEVEERLGMERIVGEGTVAMTAAPGSGTYRVEDPKTGRLASPPPPPAVPPPPSPVEELPSPALGRKARPGRRAARRDPVPAETLVEIPAETRRPEPVRVTFNTRFGKFETMCSEVVLDGPVLALVSEDGYPAVSAPDVEEAILVEYIDRNGTPVSLRAHSVGIRFKVASRRMDVVVLLLE